MAVHVINPSSLEAEAEAGDQEFKAKLTTKQV